MQFNRKNNNIFTSWWWTVDKTSLLVIILIMAFGAVMVTTASPAVAERIGYDGSYFIKRQLFFLSGTFFIMIGFSFLSPVMIRRIATIGFGVGVFLLIAVLMLGAETKGARRWIAIGSFALQPSEFMKPFFIIVTAWMLSESKLRQGFNGLAVSAGLYAMLALLLLLQPDVGMFFVVSCVWVGQLFLSGVSVVWILALGMVGICALMGAYFIFPHVSHRVNKFIGIDAETNYQVKKSLEAFNSGGMTGRGPGEGVVKQHLPDSHTDFIFAVVGEEFGAIVCVMVVGLYAFIVFRGFKKMLWEKDLFLVYAVSGLLMQFGIQAMINMFVALNLMPTKGMTLPFISYGGSSMLAIAIAMGMMLSLTRRRFGVGVKRQDFALAG
jgi:cell division protein FtsW